MVLAVRNCWATWVPLRAKKAFSLSPVIFKIEKKLTHWVVKAASASAGVKQPRCTRRGLSRWSTSLVNRSWRRLVKCWKSPRLLSQATLKHSLKMSTNLMTNNNQAKASKQMKSKTLSKTYSQQAQQLVSKMTILHRFQGFLKSPWSHHWLSN